MTSEGTMADAIRDEAAQPYMAMHLTALRAAADRQGVKRPTARSVTTLDHRAPSDPEHWGS